MIDSVMFCIRISYTISVLFYGFADLTCPFAIPSGAAAVKSGGGSPLRGAAGAGQQPVQVVIKDSPIILAQVSIRLAQLNFPVGSCKLRW